MKVPLRYGRQTDLAAYNSSSPSLYREGCQMSAIDSSSRQASGRKIGVIGGLLIVAAAVFGLLAIEQATALLAGRLDLKTRWLAWATSQSFMFGEGSLRYVQSWYERAPVRMALHMSLGGLAVILGALQFVPSLRRRHPRLHRVSGAVVWTATFASIVSAIWFLSFVPAAESASGIAFHMGLWALALLTLFVLWQAVLAVLSRDFRSHMVWMAMVYAALATAPMLRADWIAFAHLRPDVGHEWNNLATGGVVLMQTLLLMALWLDLVGDRDLPGRPMPRTVWPRWLLLLLCALSILGAIQDGVLAGGPGDPFSHSRQSLDVLPAARWLWASATIVALVLLPGAWRSALTGARPSLGIALAGAAVALGALTIGLTMDRHSLGRFAGSMVWIGYAAFIVSSLALALLRPPTAWRATPGCWSC